MSYPTINKTSIRLKNQVPVKYLAKMAFMGLDSAVSALEGRRNCDVNIATHERSIKFRPRYQNISIKPQEGRAATQYVPDFLKDLPFRALVAPLGKGEFLKLNAKLPKKIKVMDVINHLHKDTSLGKHVDVSQFNPQAISSISFHSQIYHRNGTIDPEEDVLDYIFNKEQKIRQIFLDHWALLSKFGVYQATQANLYHPLQNLTVDSLTRLSSWNEISFKQIEHAASFLPRWLGLSDQQVDLTAEHYPTEVKKLSVFIIASYSDKKNIKDKIRILHSIGLCNIGDLTLLTDPLRQIFFIKKNRQLFLDLNRDRAQNNVQ